MISHTEIPWAPAPLPPVVAETDDDVRASARVKAVVVAVLLALPLSVARPLARVVGVIWRGWRRA